MSKKQGSRVRNWSDYSRALIKRGSLALWFDKDFIRNWRSTAQGRPKAGAEPRSLPEMADLCDGFWGSIGKHH